MSMSELQQLDATIAQLEATTCDSERQERERERDLRDCYRQRDRITGEKPQPVEFGDDLPF
jgi:septal ring factor EnvC (AmiA/AmiB activator)